MIGTVGGTVAAYGFTGRPGGSAKTNGAPTSPTSRSLSSAPGDGTGGLY